MKTIVYNVNSDTLDGTETVISAASCTTNCLAPVLKVLNEESLTISELNITSKQLAELIKEIEKGTISNTAAKKVFDEIS